MDRPAPLWCYAKEAWFFACHGRFRHLSRLLFWMLAVLMLLAIPAQAQYATLTGVLQAANGLPAANYTLSFTINQWGFIAGSGVVVNTTTYCGTDPLGNVVGVANPTQPTINTPVYSGGTLPAGNYFVEFLWYTPTGTITQVSPESTAQLTAQGDLSIAPPANGAPAGTSGMRVYIGTSSGAETYQGETTGSGTFTQSTPLQDGTSPPSSNTTICKQVANDAIWPTGTGYTVSMTDPSGNTLPGYPMMWQLLGPNTTINLSNGLPYYHGVVTFPVPILASPQNQALQSINGPLSVTALYTNLFAPQTVNVGVTTLTSISGDAGAAINTAFNTYSVVQVTSNNGSPTAATPITIPNAATGVGGIPGTLVVLGSGTFTVPQILFQDSTTASVPSGLLNCPDGATIKLANGSNKTLISDTNFSSLTGGSSWYGAFQARVHGCILDGNSANNTSGWDVQLYGRALRLQNGKSFNGAQGGIWTELDHAGTGFTTKLDDFETKIEDWQSGFNTGPGLNIHSGDTDLTDVNTYLNSTWGLISSYNGVHVHGVDSYGNTLGGCWATTTGTFFGDDIDCDTYASGIGLLEDSTAGPFSLSSSVVGGPGIGIEVEQVGNVFQGNLTGVAGTKDVVFNGGSGTFIGQFCTGTGGYLFDFTGGEQGASAIITSQECSNGTMFNGTPNTVDLVSIPTNSASGSPFTQLPPATQAGGIVLTAAAPTGASGQITLGNGTTATTSCGSISGAAGCIAITVNGTAQYVPYF